MGNPDAADAIHRLDERMIAAGESRACPQAQGSTFSGTDQNPAIHLYTDDQAHREACSARDRAGQPVGATYALPPTHQFAKQDDQSPFSNSR